MHIERFYLKCLSHASYIIFDEESKEAAIVDPQRDTAYNTKTFSKRKVLC
jgi:hypothetical protein